MHFTEQQLHKTSPLKVSDDTSATQQSYSEEIYKVIDKCKY